MAPTKRVRPAFSPPRPKKVKGSSTKKSSTGAGGATKSKDRSAISKAGADTNGKSKVKPKAVDSKPRRRSRLVSPTPSNSDSVRDDNEDSEAITVDEDDEEDDTNLVNRYVENSPEPDYILAEVSHDSESTKDPPLPLGLTHRILHSHFAEPQKTKISTDAREVVGKYIEVFVREAIMRCTFEKSGDAGDGGAEHAGNGGWLDLEDLEKVAVQLCLDF